MSGRAPMGHPSLLHLASARAGVKAGSLISGGRQWDVDPDSRAPGPPLSRWSLPRWSLKHGGSGRLALLRISSGILRCIPGKGIAAEAVSLCTAWLWLSGGVPSALPSAHPVLREMGHRCGLWPEEGRGHVLSGARQGEAGAAVFGKHSPASPSAQTLPLNVVLGKNS